MDSFFTPTHVLVINVIVNSGLLIALLKVVRTLSRFEFKIEMMWEAFMEKNKEHTHDKGISR